MHAIQQFRENLTFDLIITVYLWAIQTKDGSLYEKPIHQLEVKLLMVKKKIQTVVGTALNQRNTKDYCCIIGFRTVSLDELKKGVVRQWTW